MSYSQSEDFFQVMDDQEYGSNRATLIMNLAEKLPDYKMVTGAPQVLDSLYVLEGTEKLKVAYDLVQYVNMTDKVLQQYIYVDDKLFGKNMSILFSQEEVELADNKYDSLKLRIEESNRVKYFRNGGDVEPEKKSVAAGRITIYPIKRVEHDIIELETGVLFNIEDMEQLGGMAESKGIWVYFTTYNTFGLPVNVQQHFPLINPPYATLDELMAKTAEMPDELTSEEQEEAAEERVEELEEHQKEVEAEQAAEEEKGKKKKKKKKKNKKEEEPAPEEK